MGIYNETYDADYVIGYSRALKGTALDFVQGLAIKVGFFGTKKCRVLCFRILLFRQQHAAFL